MTRTMTATSTTTTADVPAPRRDRDAVLAELRGPVHVPGDAEYAALVTPWNRAVPVAPAVVVQPARPRLAPAGRRLVPGRLRDRLQRPRAALAGHELVDHAGGRCPPSR